ncbi:MAG: prephenate dehydrogenase/arogenate dehydrogenase family protein [Betaproteobacteria bacterium]|nr:prephenate dehydrogenase/arogenate dehydrogenase family protein [Betaproteobacteria bacterium]
MGKLVVFGVGLIGASFALALKQAGAVRKVVGVGRSRANLDVALERGAIDEMGWDLDTVLHDADLVLLAVPVAQTAAVMASIVPHLPANCVVTDGGSTKQDVVAAARKTFGGKLSQFVPAHPIAGAEHSGAGAADAALYRNRMVVLAPLEETSAAAIELVRAAWVTCGARVTGMSPQRHDEVFAAVSHLPHALAFALVSMFAERPLGEELFSFAGAGFRDFTRIASSSPEMWRDICLANRDALLLELDAYQAALHSMRDLIAQGDASELGALFEHARGARNRWLGGKG